MATTLTDLEMKLVTDAEVLLTKNRIIQTVVDLFGKMAPTYKNAAIDCGLNITNFTGAKISKGENYKGLPYVVLDYPRQFAKEDIFAIRTFFWWGNFFSITLQLSGLYQVKYAPSIQRALNEETLKNWFVGCSETPWEHHFEPENYIPVDQAPNFLSSDRNYIKIAKKIPLSKWDEAEIFFEENFTFLIKVLGL